MRTGIQFSTSLHNFSQSILQNLEEVRTPTKDSVENLLAELGEIRKPNATAWALWVEYSCSLFAKSDPGPTHLCKAGAAECPEKGRNFQFPSGLCEGFKMCFRIGFSPTIRPGFVWSPNFFCPFPFFRRGRKKVNSPQNLLLWQNLRLALDSCCQKCSMWYACWCGPGEDIFEGASSLVALNLFLFFAFRRGVADLPYKLRVRRETLNSETEPPEVKIGDKHMKHNCRKLDRCERC